MRLKNVKGANEVIIKGKYYVDNQSQYKGNWCKLFNNNNPIYLEIGIGKGDFIIQSAINNPDVNYIGIEKYDSVLVRAIQKSNELELNNLKLIRMDARLIEDVFDKEIDKIYLNFSDPWPKKRHAKRRLTSNIFLDKYDKIFKSDKVIEMKTDNKDLFCYSIKTLNNHDYYIEELTFDLEKEECIDNIKTEYEEKFTKLNNPIYKIKVKIMKK